MLAVTFLIIGLIIGTRVGLRGIIMLCGTIGLIYILIKVPLGVHGFVIGRLAGSGKAELAAGLILIVSIVLILWFFLQLGEMLFDVLYLDVMPEGINRAFGG